MEYAQSNLMLTDVFFQENHDVSQGSAKIKHVYGYLVSRQQILLHIIWNHSYQLICKISLPTHVDKYMTNIMNMC